MKRNVTIAIVLAFVTFGWLLLGWKHYFVREHLLNNVQIAISGDAVYLKAGRQIDTESGTLVQLVIRRVMTFVSRKVAGQEDLFFIKINNEGTKRIEVNDFESDGSIFPFQGSLYYFFGGTDTLGD